MGPEDNPADDVQPTKEEYEAWEREQQPAPEAVASPGVALIEAERRRQITQEGWTSEHDDQHDSGEMALAAALYASPTLLYEKDERANVVAFKDPWPWDSRWDKRNHDGNVLIDNWFSPVPERI